MMDSDSSSTEPPRFQNLRIVILGLIIVLLILLAAFLWLRLRQVLLPGRETAIKNLSPVASLSNTPVSSLSTKSTEGSLTMPTVDLAVGTSSTSAGAITSMEGTIFLSIEEGGYSHLFAYQSNHPFVRLTDGAWQDITPSVSPDGSRLAFASNRQGHWDLYLVDLTSGSLTRLTDTPEYDASPSWSPDGQWLAYESYVGDEQEGNLELFIRTLDGSQPSIRLTEHQASDYSPAWSPGGRQVAFVSTRSGENEIWLADLDRTTDRFQNLSRNPSSIETHPAWSIDGHRLSWSSSSLDGLQQVMIWESNRPVDQPIPINNGVWSAWDPHGNMLIVTLDTPNRVYLTGYSLLDQSMAFPMISLPGSVEGIAWSVMDLTVNLPAWIPTISQISPTPLWRPVLISANVPPERMEVVPLEGVDAPYPMLQDQVNESFQYLRTRVATEIGWDFLADLEQAYLPLTFPLGPGMQEDWLYTARAFRFNTSPVNAGWAVVVRQDYGSQTYWRIFLRTLAQDGSQGTPLKSLPWDLQARSSGDPRAYERGGSFDEAIPGGYWLDFTRLALAYGWERLPSLSTWLTAYSSARYNEFVLRNGLDWFSAMLEIYPREALNTPTPVSSPTSTPTPTDTPTSTPTYTRTPYRSRTPTNTPTPRPTKTLSPF